MSESLGKAVLELVADLNPLKAQLAEGEAAANEMAASSARSFKGGITKAALPAAAALGIVAIGMHKAVEAAQEDQVETARLAAAYKAAGLDFHQYSGSLEESVRSSAALGFTSLETKQAMGTLVVATHDHAKATQLLSTAQDIARFKHINLASASKMLTMTMAGSTRAARALGIQVPVMADKQKQAAKVIDLVNEKLHGQADAYAKTAAGAKDKLGAETELLEENLGSALLPALSAVTTSLADATGWMTKHSTVAKIAIGVLTGVAATVLIVNGAMKLYGVYTKLAAAAQWLFNAAMDANPIGIVVIALAALGFALVMAWKKSSTFRAIVLGVWGSLKGSVMTILSFFITTIPHAFQTVLNWVKGHWKLIAVLISGPFAPLVALATNAFGVRSALVGAFHWVINFIKGIVGNVASAAKSFGLAIYHGIVNGISGLGGALYNLILGPLKGILSKVKGALGHIPGAGAVEHGLSDALGAIGLASGGIVTKPTFAMIGEAGEREAVVPLSKAADMGFGDGGSRGTTEFHFHGFVGNERELAIKFGRELQKLKARGVNFGLA